MHGPDHGPRILCSNEIINVLHYGFKALIWTQHLGLPLYGQVRVKTFSFVRRIWKMCTPLQWQYPPFSLSPEFLIFIDDKIVLSIFKPKQMLKMFHFNISVFFICLTPMRQAEITILGEPKFNACITGLYLYIHAV